MDLCPYLSFKGNCAEAFRFYEKCFGGKINALITYGDTPMSSEVPEAQKNRVMHGYLDIKGKTLMGADPPSERFTPMAGNSVMLDIEKPEEAERIFAELSKDGVMQMPMAETFWAHRFGACTDRFGIQWMVNCNKPM